MVFLDALRAIPAAYFQRRTIECPVSSHFGLRLGDDSHHDCRKYAVGDLCNRRPPYRPTDSFRAEHLLQGN